MFKRELTMNAKSLILMVLFLLISFTAYAQYMRGTESLQSLRGIKGVHVILEKLNPDIEADGLRNDSIQTDVELKLRLAGIKVFTQEESLKEPGMPYLYISVNSMKHNLMPVYAYNIVVELKQSVCLSRDLKIIVQGATTWKTADGTGIVGTQKVIQIPALSG